MTHNHKFPAFEAHTIAQAGHHKLYAMSSPIETWAKTALHAALHVLLWPLFRYTTQCLSI